MTVLKEDFHAGAFILSEGNGYISRDAIVIASGQSLKAGAVLGKITVGAIVGAAVAGNTGNGALSAITAGNGIVPGVYKAICVEPATNAGIFEVFAPNGVLLGKATVAVAFAGAINFTIADGATDFVSGDAFTITVAAGSGKYVKYDDSAADGSDVAAAVLFAAVDATAADAAGTAITRQAEVVKSMLIFDAGQAAPAQANAIADLAARGIIAR
jgi:hypothetical protein